MRLRSLVAIATLFATACAEPLVFPEWTIPVPEGLPTREYEVAAIDDRAGDHINLAADLVISDTAGDGAAAFFNPREIVVDDAGRIYVLDAGNHRVQVFASNGAFLRSFGHRGQGPGEFMLPVAMMLVDDGILINDLRAGRLSLWSREGDHLRDHAHGRGFRPPVVIGDRDTLLGAYGEERAGDYPLNVTARFTLAGEEIARVGAVPIRGRVRVRVGPEISADYAEGFNQLHIDMEGDVQPRFALGRDGALYLAAGDEYQVLALDASGAPRWALRTTMPLPQRPVASIDALVNNSRRVSSRSDLEWDPLLPAIQATRVDGHGHLWVYPMLPESLVNEVEAGAPQQPRPVDVYSAGGELLYSGLADPTPWHVAFGDFVYRLSTDPETEEPAVVRYRLIEPFE